MGPRGQPVQLLGTLRRHRRVAQVLSFLLFETCSRFQNVVYTLQRGLRLTPDPALDQIRSPCLSIALLRWISPMGGRGIDEGGIPI